MKTILSLCDLTGHWPKFYKEAGYEVICIDLQNGGDVRLLKRMDKNVHGILAAPPCTVFAGSGARWPRTDDDYREGLSIVDACLRAVVVYRKTLKWWALENPVGKLNWWLGKPEMYFQPCDYGDPYTKKTGLWGSFNTDLPLNRVPADEGSKMHLQYGGKSMRTKNARSATPLGFANAFFLANP